MENKKTTFASIDEYIAAFPTETQKLLGELRAVIEKAAPEAEEKISYQMPTLFFPLQVEGIFYAEFPNSSTMKSFASATSPGKAVRAWATSSPFAYFPVG